MSVFKTLILKRHGNCRSKAKGADFYLFAAANFWECYATTAARIKKLNLPKVSITNWEEDPLEEECLSLKVAEKDVAEFITHLTKHGSVALLEHSSGLGTEREALHYCIAVVPKTAVAIDDLDDLI